MSWKSGQGGFASPLSYGTVVDEWATWKCACGKENWANWGSLASRKKCKTCGMKKLFVDSADYSVPRIAMSPVTSLPLPASTSTAESVRRKLDAVANMLSASVQQGQRMKTDQVDERVPPTIDRKLVSGCFHGYR